MSVGKHIILDLYEVNTTILQNINTSTLYIFNDFIEHILKTANVHLLSKNIHFFDFNHENKKIDGAFTALYLLSESHLSIHTWPEKNYIAIDIFTCGNCDVEYIAQRFIDYFEPKNKKLTLLERGKFKK
jgi:S-adenosylmethionine decarboxylase proenzyme